MFRHHVYSRKFFKSDAAPVYDETPTVSLSRCEYDKKRKVLKLTSECVGMPNKIIVKSHITGKEILFTPVQEFDPLFDEDGWDGEQKIYRPVENISTIEYMVIYNMF